MDMLPQAFFGQLSATSTQLELPVFEYLGIFKTLLELSFFMTFWGDFKKVQIFYNF